MRFIFMSLAALSIVACDNDDTAAEIPDDAIFDADGDGVESDVDCDDRSASTHPGAVEICDSIDNNCNGLVDEDPIDGSTWYVDYDGDGYGSDTFVESFCSTPAAGYAKNADDCNDLEARSYPGNREVCDGVDNDCDDAVDNDPVDQVTWYVDSDGDSFGDPGISVVACDRPADEYVTNGDDCDDLNGDLNPATRWFPDMDNDGFGQPFFSVAACEPPPNHVRSDTDCADDNPDAYPGAATRDVLTLCT
ncbi:MAG: putative metal-binding motif-containing protein, partial [Myxococcota bacterium]